MVAAAFAGAAVLAGCLPAEPNGDSGVPDQVLGFNPGDPAAPTTGSQPPTGSTTPASSTPSVTPATVAFDPNAPLSHIEVEPNNNWDQAETVPFGGRVELIGTMKANVLDADVFEIGPARTGQRLEADLAAGGADIQLGLLDASHHVLAYVDPVSPTAGPTRVDIVLHEDTESLYVLVATRSSASTERAYKAAVVLSSAITTPTTHPQAIVLVFNGANQVRIGSRQPVNVPPFDIAAVNASFAGQTEDAIQQIVQQVRADYAGLNVTFYRDTDPDVPTDGVTSIYFGTSDTRLLGLADNIDPYNNNPRQSAIIYTDTFSLFNQLRPTFAATVQVLANVASHETGHLLGLRHCADAEELMDVTASARQMLADQRFKTANLHASVLPFGAQDAPTMLGWALGGRLTQRAQLKLYARLKPAQVEVGDPEDFYIPRSLLADCGCEACDLGYVPPVAN